MDFGIWSLEFPHRTARGGDAAGTSADEDVAATIRRARRLLHGHGLGGLRAAGEFDEVGEDVQRFGADGIDEREFAAGFLVVGLVVRGGVGLGFGLFLRVFVVLVVLRGGFLFVVFFLFGDVGFEVGFGVALAM